MSQRKKKKENAEVLKNGLLRFFPSTNTHLHRLHHPLAAVLTCRGRYQTIKRQKNRNHL